jgi:hypothetical protein
MYIQANVPTSRKGVPVGPAATSSGPSSLARNSPRTESRPPFRHHWRSSLSESSSELSLSRMDHEPIWIPVLARVSSHVVRLEREFHMLRSIVQTSDPDCNHTIRPIDLIRLPSDPGDAGPLLVAIFESPGQNMLREMVAFGPAWFAAGGRTDSNEPTPGEQVSLATFLDFAIGACDCLELLHYGLKQNIIKRPSTIPRVGKLHRPCLSIEMEGIPADFAMDRFEAVV